MLSRPQAARKPHGGGSGRIELFCCHARKPRPYQQAALTE
jgi:hypothetical protein